MGIFIKGAEMPMAGQIIEIGENVDGEIMARISPSFDKWHEVTFLPIPHGDLVDADELEKQRLKQELYGDALQKLKYLDKAIRTAPTIIEAEGEHEP